MNLPLPRKDETVYSILARARSVGDFTSGRAALDGLLDTHTLVPASGLPTRVGRLGGAFPEGSGVSPDVLIDCHTLLPYYAAFLSMEAVSRVRSVMLGSDGRGIKMIAGIVPSRVGAGDELRYCPDCVERDTQAVGIGLWRRAHQLPGVLVCPEHLRSLFRIDRSGHAPRRHSLLLPGSGGGPCLPSGFGQAAMDTLAAIARMSRDLLEAALPSISPESVIRGYTSRLQEVGFSSGEGRIRQRLLRGALDAQFEALRFLQPYGSLLAGGGAWNWLSCLPRLRFRAVHPLKHLLVIRVLFGDLATFLSATDSAAVPPGPVLKGEPLESRRRTRLDEAAVGTFLRGGRSLREAAARFGVSVTTVSVLADRLRVRLPRRRPKKVARDVETAVLASVKRGTSLAEVARRHRVSISYLMRLLGRYPKLRAAREASSSARVRRAHRNKITRALGRVPTPTRKGLRRRAPAAYAWLYRHDRQWLREQLARCSAPARRRRERVDWIARDARLSAQIRRIREAEASRQDRPQRLSAAFFSRRVGGIHRKHLARLPATAAMLRSCAETPQEFRQRRLEWAKKRLEREGTRDPAEWRVLKEAGIRASSDLRKDPSEGQAPFASNPHAVTSTQDPSTEE